MTVVQKPNDSPGSTKENDPSKSSNEAETVSEHQTTGTEVEGHDAKQIGSRNGESKKDGSQGVRHQNKEPSKTSNKSIQEKKIAKERPLSNYLNNITNSRTGIELSSADGKDIKEAVLLSDTKTVVRFSPVWKQTLAASGSVLLTFSAGMTSGFSAVLLPQLEAAPSAAFPHDADTASWIASMAALPMAPGCLLSGWMMEKFGRRNSHYMICGVFLLGWMLAATARGLASLLAGRFLTGLCTGLLGPLGPVFLAETSEPRLRGFFLAAVSLAIALGILAAHLIGTFMTWQKTAMISCLFPILSVALLALVPESPTWLISRGRVEDGARAFYWLRGCGDEAKAELKSIIDSKKSADAEPAPSWREKLRNLRSPVLMKPLLIMIVFFVTCQFSGVNAVAFYSIRIVEEAVSGGVDHYVGMLALDALRVVMSVVACVVCRRFGRRPLCVLSGAMTAASLAGLSASLHWRVGGAWLPLGCLLVYVTGVSLGLVPLPWIMCGEVFPTRVRGLGSGISSAVAFGSFFAVVKSAPGLLERLGAPATFLAYGAVAAGGTALLCGILPETKGRSLQEIEDGFRRNKTVDPEV